MRITIVGGGNIGTQFAVHCAEKNHEVTVYTSKPELYNGHLNIVDDIGRITHEGDILLATNDPKRAFRNSDLIIVTMPATMMHAVSGLIYEHTDVNPIIGVVPGNGGSECAFRRCIDRGNVFFGIERVPAIARLIQKGRTVKSTGYREELHIAALPGGNANMCADIISGIFSMPCTVIPNYLNLTMTPSNPILHTTRLYTLFRNWHPGMKYDFVPLFYEQWDDASSELLLACDEEVQKICCALPEFHLNFVRPLNAHYNAPTVDAMTRKISTIPAFKGLTTPTVEQNGGLIPDLHSRYFTADFSFGLTIISQIAAFVGVFVPHINEIMQWYRNIAVEKEEFRFCDYGIYDRESLRQFYLQ